MTAGITLDRPGAARRLGAWARNPWAQARFLWIAAVAYVVWTIVPVAIAVGFSFNAGKAQTTWQGFSIDRWYTRDVNSVFQDPAHPQRTPALERRGGFRGVVMVTCAETEP